MGDTILTILLLVIVIEAIINAYLWNKQKEILEDLMEDYDNLIDTQLKLEGIIIASKSNNEFAVETVKKIEKALFPNNNPTK